MKPLQLTTIVALALGALLVSLLAEFAYRKNYVCGPDHHILQSMEDAIEVAKRNVTNRWKEFQDSRELLDAIDQTQNCCGVERTTNLSGVIEWNVSFMAEKAKKRFLLNMSLSNCGTVFSDSTFKMVEATR